jgi:hypothetical protein
MDVAGVPAQDSFASGKTSILLTMQTLIDRLMPWGPVFFGALVFAPMWSAALDLSLPLMLAIGLCWGYIAKLRGRWL